MLKRILFVQDVGETNEHGDIVTMLAIPLKDGIMKWSFSLFVPKVHQRHKLVGNKK